MILELDCGNTLIKWRILKPHNLQILISGFAKNSEQLLIDIKQSDYTITFCRLVSVRSEEETAHIINQLTTTYNIPIEQALSDAQLGTVKNGYTEHQRLGTDRWLSLLAAYQLAPKASLILSFGTAITSDFINTQGQHLGGFIAPGLILMQQQLVNNTKRIHYHTDFINNLLAPVEKPANTTEKAVNGGCYLMLQGFINTQLQLAQSFFNEPFNIYTTGGDAIHFNIPNAQYTPDLVFTGLAIACPYSE